MSVSELAWWVKISVQEAFGKSLKNMRAKASLTQQQLADFSGLDRAYISELENGKLQPSLETFFRIADVLKVKPEDFIKDVERNLKK